MTSSDPNKELNEDLAQSLQVTASLMQTLLGELRDNATTLAVLKEKFDSLADKVQSLSRIVRDDNGDKSMVTRIALLEHGMKDLYRELDEHAKHDEKIKQRLHARVSNVKSMVMTEQKTEQQFKQDKLINMLKLTASVLPGLLALGLVLAKFFLGAE